MLNAAVVGGIGRERDDMICLENSELPAGCSPQIRDLYRYWVSIRPALGLPGRQHFDPVDIPHLLPNLWLVDVVGRPMRFRFRLVGTRITAFSGRDSTGKWLDEVYDDFRDTGAYHRMCLCAVDGKPIFQRGEVVSNPHCTGQEAERLYLPLASDGRRVDIILVMTIYLDDSADEAAFHTPLLGARAALP